jgi:hypothetical protein
MWHKHFARDTPLITHKTISSHPYGLHFVIVENPDGVKDMKFIKAEPMAFFIKY